MRVAYRSRWLSAIALVTLSACSRDCHEGSLDLDQNTGLLGVSPRQVSIDVGETAIVVASTRTPNSRPRVVVRDPSIASADVTRTGSGATSPGVADITITGLRPGRTVVEIYGAGDAAGTPPRTVDVEVRAPAAPTVELSPTSLTLVAGQSGSLTCVVRRGGVAVNETVRFVSSNTFVADVSADGTVTALQQGQSNIVCALPSGESAFATVTVIEPPPPGVTDISGTYTLKGTKTSDTCPAGVFPATIDNPGPIHVTAGNSGGQSFVAIRSDAILSGAYDPVTGTYSASGEVTVGSNGEVLRESVSGMWKSSPVRFEGKLMFEFLRGTLKICEASYDVTYSKRPASS